MPTLWEKTIRKGFGRVTLASLLCVYCSWTCVPRKNVNASRLKSNCFYVTYIYLEYFGDSYYLSILVLRKSQLIVAACVYVTQNLCLNTTTYWILQVLLCQCGILFTGEARHNNYKNFKTPVRVSAPGTLRTYVKRGAEDGLEGREDDWQQSKYLLLKTWGFISKKLLFCANQIVI